LAGRSLRPLLENPIADWDGTAVSQVLRPADSRLDEPVMGCSIRTQRWRYTEWGEGEAGQELYDHSSDPNEFHNLTLDPDAAAQAVIRDLRPLLRAKASGRIPTSPFNPKRL
jgi:iduronate 2-sulfatase